MTDKLSGQPLVNNEAEQDPAFIRLTRNTVIAVIVVCAALLIPTSGITEPGSQNIPAFTTLLVAVILECISLFYVFRGQTALAKVVVPFSLILAVAIVAISSNGLRSTAVLGLPVILVIAAILLGSRALFVVTPLAVAAVVMIAVFDLSGRVPSTSASFSNLIITIIILIGGAGLIQLLLGRLNESLERARRSEELQKIENVELNRLRGSLEERVMQRTAELDEANRFSSRRARQFEAIAQVVHAILSIQDLDALLPRIAQVVSEQFEVYHTGIFLLDGPAEFAILRASNSEGGQKMMARAHKLQVGQKGIVGFVTATGQPRIALDVGTDAVFFDNPDLPDTRSEIALPLRYAGRVIGALDVQSTQPNAFGGNDTDVLTTLADQIAVAINNTIILEEARKAFVESQNRFGAATAESWKVMRPKSLGLGFQLIGTSITPLERPLAADNLQEKLRSPGNQASRSSWDIPIKLRGQVVGVMHLQSRHETSLSRDDKDIAEAVAERLSLAIETATLLQTTQHRADIERVTTDISSKISSSTRFDTILQTAAQELSRALGGSDVIVQIEPAAIALGLDK